MSDVRDPETDQALPQPNGNEYIQNMVIDDLRARLQHGVRKYGTGLQANNGRDMLQDAYEEAMDLVVYLRGELEERRMYAAVHSVDVVGLREAAKAVLEEQPNMLIEVEAEALAVVAVHAYMKAVARAR